MMKKTRHLFENKYSLSTLIPAMIIALFIVLGISFDVSGSTELLCTIQPATFAIWILYILITLVLYVAISKAYGWLDKAYCIRTRLSSVSGYKWLNTIKDIYCKHPYLSVYILFFVAYLPYMIASYPAIFWGDTTAQILQGYNLPGLTPKFLKLLDDKVFLNQHYPVAHTMLIHVCLLIGKGVFKSYNIGIFIYAYLQFSFMVLVIAYVANFCYRNDVPTKVIILVILFYILHPRINNHMFLVTKEIYYGGFTLLFITSAFEIMISKWSQIRIKHVVLLSVSALGVCLFRNEGIIITSAVLLIAIVFVKDKRKYFLIALISVVTVTQLLTRIIYPALSITPGSRREMLSVPFQQTALYLNRYPEEVTEEEKIAISGVADYDKLLVCYRWDTADSSKSLFDDWCTDEQFKEYLRVWFKMFFKHPKTYFDATLHQVYGYYYPPAGFLYRVPYSDSVKLMNDANERCEEIETDFYHPEFLHTYRTIYEKGFELIARIPPIILFTLSATYLWTLLIIIFYFIRTKKRFSIILSFQLIVQFMVLFAGPLGGTCFRYVYPIVVSIIPLIVYGVFLDKGECLDEKDKCI